MPFCHYGCHASPLCYSLFRCLGNGIIIMPLSHYHNGNLLAKFSPMLS